MNKTTGFYIELPAEPGGCTALPVAVIEAKLVQGGSPEAAYFSNPDRKVLIFAAPAELVAGWAGFYFDAFGGFAETEGPARMLSLDEHQAIIARIAPGLL